MRTAFWGLACLASSALAAPGGRWGDYFHKGDEDKFPHYHPEQPAPHYYQKPSPYHPKSTETSSAPSSPSASASYSYSFTGNSTSYGPTAPAGPSHPTTTVTLITTVYTTYCPATQTHAVGGSTSLSTYMTHSTITDVITSTITVYPSPNPSTTLTEVTTVYETECPVTTTAVEGDKTITRTYQSTSTVTEVYTSTCTLEYGNGPHGNGPYGNGPHGNGPHGGAPHKPTSAIGGGHGGYGSPAPSQSEGHEGGHWGHGSPSQSQGYEGGHGGEGSYSPSQSEGHEGPVETTITKYTTELTTVCPATTTYLHGGSLTTKTYETTSTITSIYTSTIVVTKTQESTIWTTVPWGTTMFSYTIPAHHTTSSTSCTESSETGKIPHGPGSSKPSSSAPYPTNSGSTETGPVGPTGTAPGHSNTHTSPGASGSHPGMPSGSGPSGSHSVPTGSHGPFPSGSGTHSGFPTGSGSHSIFPTGSGSHSGFPTGSGSHTIVPTGTSSSTYSSGNTTTSAPGSSGILPTHPSSSFPAGNTTTSAPGSTGLLPTHPSASFPAGNSTISAPTGSGTAPSTHTPSSTSSSSCSKPTPTGLLGGELCIPCQGQPGFDKFCGYTVDDDSYKVMPKTCRTVEYFFEISNQTVAPDGIPRIGLVINGQMPGPKIEANWGDTIVVHVTNMMQNNGTSIHWHGMRQYLSNEQDGVPSITQCAIAPGDSMTYTFKATNYGTSWYHSHFALQTYEGVFGPMVIHGPTDEVYLDEEMIVIQDWSHATADSMYQSAQTVGPAPDHGPRTLDTGLINGMNIWGVDGSANATGQRFKMTVIPGATYRLRLVNTAIQSTFKFYIDGHKFKVFAMDFVPIIPYETNIVNINIGQRYDLLFKADQPIANYWMRADNQDLCATITHSDNIKGIVSYVGAGYGTPTSTAYNYTPECVDEPYASLVPRVPMTAGGTADQTISETVVVGANGGSPNLYKWTLSGTTFQSQWGDPTLSSIVNNGSIPTYSGDLAIQVPKLKEWVYVIIDSPIPLPHPIHLHGHDFLVLAQGPGLYNSDVVLNTVNPPRRDVALMPWDPVTHVGGHLVLAFETDNPGVWLMHCHIGWHTSMGFALQIIEAQDEIKKHVTNSCQLDGTCKKWHGYTEKFGIEVDDSGV